MEYVRSPGGGIGYIMNAWWSEGVRLVFILGTSPELSVCICFFFFFFFFFCFVFSDNNLCLWIEI